MSAESARLTPLGTGSILMQGGRSASSYLLELGGQKTLIDCGPGTLLRLQQAGVDAATVEHVVLSHFHPDHHADLLGLLFLRVNPSLENRTRLTIHAPPGIRRILDAWRSVYGDWIAHPDDEVHEIEPAHAHRVGRWTFQAFRAAHTMPAYCYRITGPSGLRLAYSGDSDLCDELVEACRDVDFCWLECSFPDSHAVQGHLTPGRIHDALARARPRHAALTHFYPPMFPMLEDRGAMDRCFGDLETSLRVLQDLEPVELDDLSGNLRT